MDWEYDPEMKIIVTHRASMCKIILCTQMKMLNSLYCQFAFI
jgi:hypothetical protein